MDDRFSVLATATPSASAREAKARVRRYYQAATEDYLKYYESDWHHHMHYGFDRGLPKGGNPTENLVRYLAGIAHLLPGRSSRTHKPAHAPRVLDAGCGVGGSAIWLAKEAGCSCVGITLVESQAHLAMGFASQRGVAPVTSPGAVSTRRDKGRARFLANDFTTPAFKPGSFDVVWALESFDHAPDKEDWIGRIYDLLKPGGRLLIADGFRADRPFSTVEDRVFRRFLAGWAVPHLCTARELKTWAIRAGFEVEHEEDISADVMPHARAIFRFGLVFIPVRWVLHRLGWTSGEKLGNAVATYHQYGTLKKKLWHYGVYCFKKYS
ncbi:MAG TPA: methyltransferase domain-containing protein [Fibrobacteria bacterium]|nr:methyltransferase domain-containing protein [Fibrobacteria bacterium]